MEAEVVKLTVSDKFEMPPRYAESRPEIIKAEHKRLIEEYEDDVLYELTEASIEILCLMALADAFGFEYGEFVN